MGTLVLARAGNPGAKPALAPVVAPAVAARNYALVCACMCTCFLSCVGVIPPERRRCVRCVHDGSGGE